MTLQNLEDEKFTNEKISEPFASSNIEHAHAYVYDTCPDNKV